MESGNAYEIDSENIFVRKAITSMIVSIRSQAIARLEKSKLGIDSEQRGHGSSHLQKALFADACEKKLKQIMFTRKGSKVVYNEATQMQRNVLSKKTCPVAAATIFLTVFLSLNPRYIGSGLICSNSSIAGILTFLYVCFLVLYYLSGPKYIMYFLYCHWTCTLALCVILASELLTIATGLMSWTYFIQIHDIIGFALFTLTAAITWYSWPQKKIFEPIQYYFCGSDAQV